MLPVYNAISFVRILEKGGRTKPWVVVVQTPTGLKSFVVKLFETSLIDYRDSVTNEVAGNILAKEFGLPVPNAALIDFDARFLNTIRNQELQETLLNRDKRLKFATEEQVGYSPFD